MHANRRSSRSLDYVEIIPSQASHKKLKQARKMEKISSFPEIRSLPVVRVAAEKEPTEEDAPTLHSRRSKRRKLFHVPKKLRRETEDGKLSSNGSFVRACFFIPKNVHNDLSIMLIIVFRNY